MKILLIGNCQVNVISAALRLLLPDHHVEQISIAPLLQSPDAPEWSTWRDMVDDADAIITQDADVPALGELSNTELAKRRKLTHFPYVHFEGLHPDALYLRATNGALVRGPMGAYQSAIAVAACLEGLSIDRTVNIYNAYIYGSLGYFSAWDRSAQMAKGVFARSAMNANMFDKPSEAMFIFNHPRATVAIDIARQIAGQLQLATVDVHEDQHPPLDALMSSTIWPVYPEIAEHLGIPPSDIVFVRNSVSNLDLKTFVSATFASLKDAPQIDLPKVTVARALISREVR